MATDSEFVLSGFADEISTDLDVQLEVLDAVGVDHLDLRSVDGTDVLELSADDLDAVEAALAERDISVPCIGSPVGKVEVTEPFDEHLDRFERTLAVADRFDADYVRVFSYYVPDGDDPADWRGEVLRRMRAKADRAADADVTLLLENEGGLYGDTPGRCRDVLTAVDSPHLRAVFDPANFVVEGIDPYPDALLLLVEFVDYVHVKDALADDGSAVPAGEGDADVAALLETLRRRGFSGVLSLEPHLYQSMDEYDGPAAFRTATDALTDVIASIGGTYR